MLDKLNHVKDEMLDELMKAIKLVYPKEYELVMRKISDL